MIHPRFTDLSTEELRIIDTACQAFEEDFARQRSALEQHLAQGPIRIRSVLFEELLAIEIELRARGGALPKIASYETRFLDRKQQVQSVFQRIADQSLQTRELSAATSKSEIPLGPSVADIQIPDSIGRFRIDEVLGQGGFGIVYKARDEGLDRAVAIKVPRARFFSLAQNEAEAKIVAKLDHPNIVPVYELGSNEDFPFYIVSKYIDGSSLSQRIKLGQIGDAFAAIELIATVARALHYAHERGLVHRDVKAGLMPRLSNEVEVVYVEASPEETETRLLHGLWKHYPSLQGIDSLKDALTALRLGRGVPVGKKVLIVLDQFEQWLHAKKEGEYTDLAEALRQCDGRRVQCIMLVRDDFWLAVSRFLHELEVRLVEGHNIALVDLFNLKHACRVLAAFGRAFGRLPENIGETTKAQNKFLQQAVAGLAEDGKVICVRLALFADMMKDKLWVPATLKELGGTKGVGVKFLKEVFSAPSANPSHRLHQKAARAVLKDLLPDYGTDIKGTMRSQAELMEASGYGDRPQDFNDLIKILDSEIRLITPTDPDGHNSSDDSVTQAPKGQLYFQLTHDYLVHSLREWLTRKQKETASGRAELKLFDHALLWNAEPKDRFLPSWWENLNIRLFTNKRKWTEPQRKMMAKAGRVHGIRTGMVALLLLAASFIGLGIRKSVVESQNLTRATALVDSLGSADIAQVPFVISDLNEYREWADPLLKAKPATASDVASEKLHLSLALLPVDESQIEYLRDQLPVCSLTQFPVLRTGLLPYKDKLVETLWMMAMVYLMMS